jgi:hypothetical protein
VTIQIHAAAEKKLEDAQKNLAAKQQAVKNAEDAPDALMDPSSIDRVKQKLADATAAREAADKALDEADDVYMEKQAVIVAAVDAQEKAEAAQANAASKLVITEGDGASYDESTPAAVRMASNGSLEYLKSVLVDGSSVDPSLYRATAGSTVLELSEGFAKTLSEGAHELTFQFEYGDVTGAFEISKAYAAPIAENGKHARTASATAGTAASATTAESVATASKSASATPQTADELPAGLLAALFASMGVGAYSATRRAKHARR